MKKHGLFYRIFYGLTGLVEALSIPAAQPRSFSSIPSKILVMGYMGAGDLLMLAPSLNALKSRFPNCHITLLTGPYSAAGQLAQALAAIDEVISIDWKNIPLKNRAAALGQIKSRNFDVLLATYTAPVRYFIPALKEIPIRAGMLRDIPYPQSVTNPWSALLWKLEMNLFQEEFFKRRLFNRAIVVRQDSEHEIEKDRRLLQLIASGLQIKREIPINIPPAAKETAQKLLAKNEVDPSDKLIIVHPSASPGQDWKRWPAKHFLELCQMILKNQSHKIILVGAAEEWALIKNEFESRLSERLINLMGQTTLVELAALLEKASVFIGTDSGPGHLALAVGTPTVRIFGASDNQGYKAWREGAHLDIAADLGNGPRLSSGVFTPGQRWSTSPQECLEKLTPESVYSKLNLR